MQIDIHSHIIPGVDDGSPDLETSLGLLRMAAENGTTDIIATPHVIDVSTTLTWDAIRRYVEALQKEADDRGIPIKIHPGHLEEMIYELQLLDIVPVLAHPERQMQLMEQPQKLLDLLHRGCVAQSNGGSLTGVFGPKVHENVHRLLHRNMIAFMGSDAHNLRHRNTDLKGAREKLEQHWGAEATTELLETRPLHILQNKALPPELYADRLPRTFADEDRESLKKKNFFAKLFG